MLLRRGPESGPGGRRKLEPARALEGFYGEVPSRDLVDHAPPRWPPRHFTLLRRGPESGPGGTRSAPGSRKSRCGFYGEVPSRDLVVGAGAVCSVEDVVLLRRGPESGPGGTDATRCAT